MREIIYIQAGRLANYTGTHFWNTQESYIPYGEDDPENADVDSKISFSESVDEQVCNGLLSCMVERKED